MRWLQACELCRMGLHGDCYNADCFCCGNLDFDYPNPEEAGSDEYGREEDARLDQQLGPWQGGINEHLRF
jgi:hypothetical protein